MILLCVAMILYLGTELGTSNWVAEYFVRELNAPIRDSSFAVSALWIGLLVGRLGLSAVKRRGRQESLLLAMSLFCVAALIGFLSVRRFLPAMTLVFALGLGYAGIYPLLVTLAGQAFRSSAAVGMLATSAGIGSFAFPYLLAAIAQAAGLKSGFFLSSRTASWHRRGHAHSDAPSSASRSRRTQRRKSELKETDTHRR